MIKDLKKQALDAKNESGKPDLQKRAEILDVASTLDPEDLALCGEVANAWLAYANIAGHGNSCDHNDGCKKAIPLIEKILKLYPENTSWLIRLGNCYQAMGDGKAKSYYKRVIEICGKDKGDGRNAAASWTTWTRPMPRAQAKAAASKREGVDNFGSMMNV